MRHFLAILLLLIAPATLSQADDIVVLLHREGCGPCEQALATLTTRRELLGDASLALVDIEKHPLLALRYRVRAVPVFVLERDGVEVARKTGFDGSSQLAAWLRRNKK